MSEGWVARFQHRADALVAFLERDRLSILGMFVYVILIALVRDISEYYLLDHAFVSEPHPWIFSIAHHVSFYLITFMGLVLLLSAFTRRGVRRTANFVSSFFWIIVLPPFLDHFLFGSNQNYAYFSVTDFLNYLFHFSGQAFHPGQAVEIITVVAALFAYAVWTKRGELWSVRGRVVALVEVSLLVSFTFMALFFMATPGAYLPVGSLDGRPVFPNFDVTRYVQYHLFIFAYYCVMAVALGLALLYLARKGSFKRFVASMRPAQSFFFLGIVTAGIAMGWLTAGGSEYVTGILATPYWINLAFVAVALVAAWLAWEVSTMWNDLSDRSSDSSDRPKRTLPSGLISASSLAQVSVVLTLSALFLAALLSWTQALLLGGVFALSFLYSFPPFRFKEHILSPILMGLGAFLAFIYGFLTPFSEIVTVGLGPVFVLPTGDILVAALTPLAILSGFYAFLGLVIGSMVTDVDGYEEDIRGKVRTIYTRLGLRWGTTVVAALIFSASLTSLAMFTGPLDVILLPVLGIVAAGAFYRRKSSRPVLAVAALGLLYAAVRFVEILPH